MTLFFPLSKNDGPPILLTNFHYKTELFFFKTKKKKKKQQRETNKGSRKFQRQRNEKEIITKAVKRQLFPVQETAASLLSVER